MKQLAYPMHADTPAFSVRERIQIVLGAILGTLAFFVGVGLLFAAGSVQ